MKYFRSMKSLGTIAVLIFKLFLKGHQIGGRFSLEFYQDF